MEFPKRPTEHIKETESWKILQNKVPSSWIVHDVSQEDYGIDAYLEIVSTKGEVTGDLCLIQLKSSASIEWNKEKEGSGNIAKFSGIKKSTVNYWMHLPVPVFLLWADISKKSLFFAPIKVHVRKHYSEYTDSNQKTLSFDFYELLELGGELGLTFFKWHYEMEKGHPQFINYLRGLLIHSNEYFDFILNNQGLDCFMEVEHEDQLMMIHIYSSCQFLAKYLSIEWKAISLSEAYRKDQENWKEPFCLLHEQTLDQILKELQPIFIQVIKRSKDLVLNKQKDYWFAEDPILFNRCLNLNTEIFERYS